MNGDLSLSQALGGLRIANPDATTQDHPPRHANQTPHAATTNNTSTADRELSSVGDLAEGTNNISTEHYPNETDRQPHTHTHTSFDAPDPPAQHSMSAHSSWRSLQEAQMSPCRTANCPEDESMAFCAMNWPNQRHIPEMHLAKRAQKIGKIVVLQLESGEKSMPMAGRFTVYLATDKQTLKEYAIKVLEKRHIIKEKKIKYVNIEKNTLNRLTEHPGIVRLYYTFQDEASLYYVLDLCNGGELLGVLKKTGSFDVDCGSSLEEGYGGVKRHAFDRTFRRRKSQQLSS
ncbi:hypothetical protein MY5147_009771 [Beauveria neobassiana]